MKRKTDICNRRWIPGLCLVLLLSLSFCLCACTEFIERDSNAEVLQSEAAIPTMMIDTVYGTLEFPETLEQNLRHVEVTEGNTAMEVFYMLQGEERELFRIYYNSAAMGTQFGYLVVEGREVPVTYTVCDYEKEDFTEQGSWELYCSMMDGFTTILNSIHADSRFSPIVSVEFPQDTMVQLTYWQLPVPETVVYEELIDGSTYRVNFYGMIGSEHMLLYSIQLGEPELQTHLGDYFVDGTPRSLSVETNEILMDLVLEEEEQIRLYDMMDSINGVLEVILSDKNFAE